MARVNRSSVLLWLQDLLSIQSGTQQVPVETPNSIQPVVEVGPRTTLLVRSSSASTTAASTTYTTPSDKDFFLTYIHMSWTKDAANDCTRYSITSVIGGASRVLASMPVQPLTAGNGNLQITFPHPIKLDRNAVINMNGAFTVGTQTRDITIGGFILE